MKQTSRQYILDLVEVIINQIQMSSHLQELINVSSIDMKSYIDEGKHDEALTENKKYIEYKYLLEDSIKIRRDSMEKLMKEFKGNYKYRCLFKHSLSSYWFMTEVQYATKWTYDTLQQDCYEQMIKIISMFLELDEIVTCWRCAMDMLEDKMAYLSWEKSNQPDPKTETIDNSSLFKKVAKKKKENSKK